MTSSAALEGWRVLELATGVAGQFCSKVLADLGAEVLKVEPPGGVAARQSTTPFDVTRFAYLNTGKHSVVVASDDHVRLAALVAEADVVVTDRHDLDAVLPAHIVDHVVWTTILPFGRTGPRAHWRAHHLVTFHSGGEGAILPSGLGF